MAATQDDVDAAKREADLAKARQDKAEAEAAESKARLGALTVQGVPTGKGEASSLNVEGKILAYKAIDQVASSIASTITPTLAVHRTMKVNGQDTSVIPPLVIYGEKELNALMQARALRRNVALLDSAIVDFAIPDLASDAKECVQTKGGAGLAPLAAIDVGLQVLSLFRIDKKISGMDVTVDDFALAMAVMQKVRQSSKTTPVVLPASYLPGAFASDDDQDIFRTSKLMALLDKLVDDATGIDPVLADIGKRRDDIKKRSEDKKATATCKDAYRRDTAILDNLEARGKGLQSRVDKLMSAVTTVDDKTGATILQNLAIADSLADTYKGAYILQLKPIAAGGATLAKTSFFSTSFQFSGGAIVSYLLVDGVSGQTVNAGTVTAYGGFVKEDELPTALK